MSLYEFTFNQIHIYVTYIIFYILYIYVYILYFIILYMVFILSEGFLIPYRKLTQVGFEPTTSCLLCTHSNGLQDQVTTKLKSLLGDCSS